MELHLAPFQSFRCNGCGRCCRNSWSVEVEPVALSEIAASVATQSKERQGYQPLVVLSAGQTVTGRDSSGACLYLDSVGLCELHAELGAEKKPLACQLYPYSVTSTPDGRFASLSFACPVALWGSDENLEVNRSDLQSLLQRRGATGGPLPETVEIVRGRAVPWSSYLQLEAALSQRLQADLPARSSLGAVGSVLSILAATPGDTVPDWSSLTADAPDEEFEEQLLEMVCASLIALLELPDQPELRQEFSQALQAGAPLVSPRHRYPLPALSFGARPDALLETCFERYLANFLFGKALLCGTVVSRLLGLAAGTALIVYYSQAFESSDATLRESNDATLREANQATRREAISRAFELVEAELLTHSRSTDPLFASLEETFCTAYGLSMEEP